MYVLPLAVLLSCGFVSMGQSNNAGRGECNATDRVAEPGVYLVRSNGAITSAIEPYDLAAPTGFGTGFQRTFARELINRGACNEVWIAQCAVAATHINSWIGLQVPTGTTPLTKSVGGPLYSNCLMQASVLKRQGVPILGVIWHQGETGCANNTEAALYFDKLSTLRFRMGYDFPGAPMIAGELAPDFNCVNKDTIHAAMNAVADRVVSSEGLITRDGTHFNRDSLRILGMRYAEKMLELLQP